MSANSHETPPQRVNDFLRTKKVWEGVWEEDRSEFYFLKMMDEGFSKICRLVLSWKEN